MKALPHFYTESEWRAWHAQQMQARTYTSAPLGNLHDPSPRLERKWLTGTLHYTKPVKLRRFGRRAR